MNVSRYWLRWFLGLVEGPRLSFFDLFGDKSQKTTNTNTSYQDSFNKTDSWVRSMADSGNTNLTIGQPAGGSGMLGDVLPLVIAAFAMLGGLFLITRKS